MATTDYTITVTTVSHERFMLSAIKNMTLVISAHTLDDAWAIAQSIMEQLGFEVAEYAMATNVKNIRF